MEIKSTPPRFAWGIGRWQFWLGLVFSLLFLWLALREVNFPQLAQTLRAVNGWLLAAALLNSLLSILARGLRWQRLLAARKTPAFGRTFSALAVGLMANTFFPARLGDFARAYILGETESDSKAYLLGSIALEKLADLLFLLFSLLILLSQLTFPGWLAAPAQASAVGIFLLLPLFLLLLWQKNVFLRLMESLSRWLFPRWQAAFLRQTRLLLDSLDVIRQPRALLNFLLWSLLVWAVSVFTNSLVFWAMGLSLPWWSAIFILAVLQAGIVVPSSPGRVGVFQYLLVLALSVLAVEKNAALGYSLVLYLVVYLPVILLGVYYLWREQAAWQKMSLALNLFRRAGNPPQ
ncbi:MAG: hypothetical protein Fur0035_18460 [Anaerolineales bacterium]